MGKAKHFGEVRVWLGRRTEGFAVWVAKTAVCVDV